jgi:phospholipase C
MNNGKKGANFSNAEKLLKTVYESLRKSDYWNESLLIVTYDEHGGFYDHVSPPVDDVPRPDENVAEYGVFNFTQLGVRVPVLLISPWVEKGGGKIILM